ncbi:Protein ccc1 [Ophidiomyces ophidiicola]|uniref:Protein ccc1 n=1 Tax=Ophidiomyces ophidiicola TaxID=1387563 RepID=A0ACB8V5C2_9EURO|nr:Protein ccc1 [Ophidiomyces ophidiicola]KAI1906174.1 Protein ccc1 [Ophidiomyces ophidiicola]KAI1906383.1 Protein ccc1 [Ophidiomyces ophidiicola]KAI1920915.1 Protein ccc1 [Ophidiomyces ophidiicola]KAI1953790.1 Protein ccc1 [Ophidiomyces ophidiicola]KAI1954800.1 Protein ccc1 [Ophidiomyces ophidiicola]
MLAVKRSLLGPDLPSAQESLRKKLEHRASIWRSREHTNGVNGVNGEHRRLLDLEDQNYHTINNSRDDSPNGSSRTRINPKIISDAILGLSDGLTVPFALSAGLSALGNTRVVVLGGLAELAAGAISMGLGGYVGGRSEIESYQATKRETEALIHASPEETTVLVRQVFARFGVPERTVTDISNNLHDSPSLLMDFLLTFHHGESAPFRNQALISGITLAVCYFIGGFIPLVPYFYAPSVSIALNWSIGVMGVTLFIFGYVKTCVVRGWNGKDNTFAGLKGGFQMVLAGGLAAGAAIALVRGIDQGNDKS